MDHWPARWASARRSNGWRTTATCGAAAGSWPISGCPACWTSPSCAARLPMPGSMPCASPLARSGTCSRRRTWTAWQASGRTQACRASAARCSRSSPLASCATWANRSPPAWPPAVPAPRTWRRGCGSTWRSCPPSPTWPARGTRRRRWCTSTGRRTCSSRRRSTSRSRAASPGPRPRSTPPWAPPASAWRRWRAAAWSRRGTTGRNSSSSPPPPSSRTSCAAGWPSAWDWRKGASAWSLPMSAAASATRACCWPRRWSPASSPCACAAPSAGSRTGAST